MSTFTFTFTPDNGATKVKKPNVRSTQYGDGYEQRVTYGINQNPAVWQLTFSNRDYTETDAIEAFLDAREGTESFDWTPPNEATALKFICREWNVRTVNAAYKSLTATFEQVFE